MIFSRIAKRMLRGASAGKRYRGTLVAVAGLYRTPCGLQRGADLMRMQFERDGVRHVPVDISEPGAGGITVARSGLLQPQDLAALPVSDIVIHANPPLFSRVLQAFAPQTIERATIVGFWAWETNRLPVDWPAAAARCDEIWTPSAFVADTLRRALPSFRGPITIVPHPVACDPIPRLPSSERRRLRRLRDLSADLFVVGTSFSFHSNYARKNPAAAIDAFREAFPRERDVRLVLRCLDAACYSHIDDLVNHAAGDDRIAIVRADTIPWPIVDFYNCLDAYISLHRSEGYGLTLVEAAQTGLPVVTTAYALAADIAVRREIHCVDYELVPARDPDGTYEADGALWAEPNVHEAAVWLRRLRVDHPAPNEA